MKNEFKRIDQDITGIVADIPTDELRQIYCKKLYDILKTYYIDGDDAGSETKTKDLNKFVDRMSPAQKFDCLDENMNAFNRMCYDLRLMLRSESIFSMSTMFAHLWLIGSIKDDLEAYKHTGDDYWIDSALDLCNRILNPFYEKYGNDETLKDLKDYVERLEKASNVSDEDKERLGIFKDWIRVCELYKELEHAETSIND